MFPPSSPPLLDETLRLVERRYRLPAIASSSAIQETGPATALAFAIEQAREALSRGDVPDPALKHYFTAALARLIHEAMHVEGGDPVFQAAVLRHSAAQVREYASLAAHADQDRRLVHSTVNAIAHPAKQERIPPGEQRKDLAQLHACAASASWTALFDTARRLLRTPEATNQLTLERGLTRLLQCPALERLRRLETLASDKLVRRYESLWDRNGPRSGSHAAIARGSASQQRGAAVETLAAQALQVLARRLNEKDGSSAHYRVVTSMRVPASIPASAERAKSEWDAVLLRQAPMSNASTADASTVWDVCLLVEAKASVDAATTDLPRLLRGLRLLAHAEESAVYSFKTRQGAVCLRGASLRALTTDTAGLRMSVLYCCDAAAEAAPRLLSAASRMQLLSAPASVEFASTAQKRQTDPESLEPVWHDLLASNKWSGVLHQYPMLRQVRELMVHTDDFLDAVSGRAGPPSRRAGGA